MSHNHNHSHSESEITFEKPIIIGIILNTAFIVIEIVYGLISNSISLITDAGHNFSDVIALVLAWAAVWLVKKKSSPRFTYGYKKASILIALVNSVILLVALGAITMEAVQRFYSPHKVDGQVMIIVASIGIVVNGVTALFFFRGKDNDLNIKGVFLHMVTDTLVSLGVVISGVIIILTGIQWVDPLVSLVIVVVILYGTWGLLRDTTKMALDAVPLNIDSVEVRKFLEGTEGVENVHDLHIWAMSTSQNALTAHLVVPDIDERKDFLVLLERSIHDKFKIGHSTFQIECSKPEDSHHCDC